MADEKSTLEISSDEETQLREALDTPLATEKEDPLKTDDKNLDSDKDKNKDTEKDKDKDNDETDEVLGVELTEEQKKEKEEADKLAAEKGESKNTDENSEDLLTVIDFKGIANKAKIEYEGEITSEEDFVKALETTFTKRESEMRTKLLDEVTELAGYDPQAQFLIRAVNAGLNPEELIAPTKSFDTYLTMDDETLMVNSILVSKKTDYDASSLNDAERKAQAELEVETLKEDGQLKDEANKIRASLNAAKSKHVETHRKTTEEYVTNRMNELKVKSEKFDKEVVDAIQGYKQLFDVPVDKALMDQIAKKFTQTDEYRTRLTSDPKFLADLIVKKELSERALKARISKLEKQIKKEEKIINHQKNYNTDDISKETKSTQSTHVDSDSFSEWEAIKNQSVTRGQ